MRLRIFFIFFLSTTMLMVAQNAQKRISVSFSNIPLSEAIIKVEKASGYTFFYDAENTDLTKKVSVSADNKSIKEVMDILLKTTNLSYELTSTQIALFAKTKTNIGGETKKKLNASGVVLDKEGETLIGVAVVVKGTQKGTFTDVNGRFTMPVEKGDILHFSYLGFTEISTKVENELPLNLVMAEDSKVLDDVVVTALGIRRSQKTLSYNVQEIKSDELTSIKDANFMNSLAGKVAGVNINASSSGIGGATRVVMRGTKSIFEKGNNNALYVIDGVPLFNTNNGETSGRYSMQPKGEGISDINSDDIESMTVLTGPAAAALYGSNAANGAILITTKKGKSGKARVTISNNTNFSKPFILPRFQNTYKNRTDEYASWGDKMETPSSYKPKDFFQTGVNVQNAVSLSVGSDKNQSYISFATTNADGIILNNTYSRYNFTFRNTTSFLNDKMTLDVGFNYIKQRDQNMMAQGDYFNPLTSVYTYPRGEDFDDVRMFERYDEGRKIDVQHWIWGDQGMQMQNPYWIAKRNLYGTKKNRYMANASLKYNIFDWVNVIGRVRIDDSNSDYTKKLYATTVELFSGPKGFYQAQKENEKQIYADVIANINKTFGEDYTFSANIGASISDGRDAILGYQGPLKGVTNFFSTNNIDKNGRDAGTIERGWHEQTQSIFASAELGWRNMLYLTVTGRNDWASALAETEKNSFFYPSVGLSGVVSEMVKLPKVISFLKVRGSYSSVGSPILRYLSMPRYEFDKSTEEWKTATRMPADKLRPERTKSWEFGLTTKLLDGRIGIDATYYKSNTYNQTIEPKVSASISGGYSSIIVQSGNVRNYGMELGISGDNKWGDFQWNSNFVFSFNRNKIIELADSYIDARTGISYPISNETFKFSAVGSSEIFLQKGGTMGDLWTTSALEKDQEGNIWVDPATGELAINNKVSQKVGSILPKYNMSFRNDFSWKGFNAGFMLSARLGGIVVSGTQAVLDGFGVTEETANARDNGGIPVNNGVVNAETWYRAVGKGGVMSHYIYSATNVRLQEARIGYTFPTEWFNSKMKVSLSAVGRNLWMIYNKAPYDPELTASTGTYNQGGDYFMQPSLRNIGFSVNVQF